MNEYQNKIESTFKLTYEGQTIGFLGFRNGIWSFCYSEEFKKQDKLKPLLDFPYIHKVYTFKKLNPFFVIRIPGLGQPEIKRILEKEKIDKNDEVRLLERFGQKSIANPFELYKI